MGVRQTRVYVSLRRKGKKYFQTGGCEGKRKVQLPLAEGVENFTSPLRVFGTYLCQLVGEKLKFSTPLAEGRVAF